MNAPTGIDDPLATVTGQPTSGGKPKNFPAMLNAWLPEIRRALPKHLNADRMARIALTAFRRTPKLANCDPRSVFAAVIQAAQLGLEPDTLGRSYLIPYGQECQFVPGWKGLVDLMNRSGQGSVYTGVIFRDQAYKFIDGSKRELIIENETELVDPSDITHAYAIGHIKGGMFPVIELWRMAKVIKHRDRYNKVGAKHYSFSNLEMYARKVVLLQVLKYMPCSPELVMAMALNDAAEMGEQKIDLKEAIEGSWEPVPEAEAETSTRPKQSDAPKEPTRKKGVAEDQAPPAQEQAGGPTRTPQSQPSQERAPGPLIPAGAIVHFVDERKKPLGALPYRQGMDVGKQITIDQEPLHITELHGTENPLVWVAEVTQLVPATSAAENVGGLMDQADAATSPAAPKPRGRTKGNKPIDFGALT